MYLCVLFSDDGAQVLTIAGTVCFLYRRMYLLRMQNAALSPYSRLTNSSNAGSVGLFRSPSHVFPILMFRGLLLRIPRGTIRFILFIEKEPYAYNAIGASYPRGFEKSVWHCQLMGTDVGCISIQVNWHGQYLDRVI